MKLIDLLVQELPKLGGWPCGDRLIAQDYDGQLAAYSRIDKSFICYEIPENITLDTVCDKPRVRGGNAVDHAEFVSVEQYEAALAAPKQIVWNGRGLPPVGCECEVKGAAGDDSWAVGKILSHTKFKGRDCAVFQTEDTVSVSSHEYLRPIRPEEERKRDEFAQSLCDHLDDLTDWDSPVGKVHALAIYDAIAAGKIPGIKLAD